MAIGGHICGCPRNAGGRAAKARPPRISQDLLHQAAPNTQGRRAGSEAACAPGPLQQPSWVVRWKKCFILAHREVHGPHHGVEPSGHEQLQALEPSAPIVPPTALRALHGIWCEGIRPGRKRLASRLVGLHLQMPTNSRTCRRAKLCVLRAAEQQARATHAVHRSLCLLPSSPVLALTHWPPPGALPRVQIHPALPSAVCATRCCAGLSR